uniref:Uncharacterized protein n=1 Tax=Hyaloperonospora arabidopsidis (strain Emoy2) TaxID=559515 RepID=M4B4I8_HYAAE
MNSACQGLFLRSVTVLELMEHLSEKDDISAFVIIKHRTRVVVRPCAPGEPASHRGYAREQRQPET